MDIKQFLSKKLNNFHKFLVGELAKVTNKSDIITDQHIETFEKEITFMTANIEVFMSLFQTIKMNDIDECIKMFLLKYNINIEDIINDIDYDKLKRYIEMFNEVINN